MPEDHRYLSINSRQLNTLISEKMKIPQVLGYNGLAAGFDCRIMLLTI
jgi:hypothetical protein